jgi:hypothetical protein
MMELYPTAAPPDDGHSGTYTRPGDVLMVVSEQEVERAPGLPPLHRDGPKEPPEHNLWLGIAMILGWAVMSVVVFWPYVPR